MKICIVARSISKDHRGSFEFDQALSLCNAGHEVCLISLDLRSILRSRPLGINREEENGVRIVRISIPLGAINKRIFYKISAEAFKIVFNRENKLFNGFDIVHAHFLDNIYISLKALSKMRTRPVIVGTEHSNVAEINSYKRSPFMKKTIYNAYSGLDKLITVSKNLSDILMKEYNVKSYVIHNVVDTSLFTYDVSMRENNSKTIFCSVGTLTKNKRMDLLIECFYKAFGNDNKYMLYICGSGEEKENLLNEIKRLNCENNVKLLGSVSRKKIFDIFQHSDFFILLSKKETFGVAFVEAMASGLPVLSTKSGGPEEFINEKVGILLEDDKDYIVSKMRDITSNERKYNRSYISNYASENFSPEAITNELIEVYSELL